MSFTFLLLNEETHHYWILAIYNSLNFFFSLSFKKLHVPRIRKESEAREIEPKSEKGS